MDRNPGELESGRLREIQNVTTPPPGRHPATPIPPLSRKYFGLWAAIIFFLSVIPIPEPLFKEIKFSDLGYHAAFYFPLAAFLVWAYPERSALWRGLAAAAVALAFGFMIELIQALLPWRQFSLVDASANLVGGALGGSFALLFPRFHLLRLRNDS